MSTKTITDFKDIHKGQRCFIIGTGPSLNQIDFKLIKDEILFGCNDLYEGYEQFGIKCKYYAISDNRVWNDHHEKLLNYDHTLFVMGKALALHDEIEYHQEIISDIVEIPVQDDALMWAKKRFPADMSKGLYGTGSVVADINLQIAYHMGFKEVYLLGVDHDFSGKKQHFNDHETWANNLDTVLHYIHESYKVCNKEYKKVGKQIINCTPRSKETVFPKTTIEELLYPDCAVFITARMGSTRLPGKVFMKINGRPLIRILTERICHDDYLKKITYMTTTILKEDNILEKLADNSGIKCYRGHPTNLLDRWYHGALGQEALHERKIKFIVNVHGDNPLVDPIYIREMIKSYYDKPYDFGYYPDLPFGTTPYAFTTKALGKALEMSKYYPEKEGQYRWFEQTGLFKVKKFKVKPELKHPEIRMTLDYYEDLRFFGALITCMNIVEGFGKDIKINHISLEEIVKYLLDSPGITGINDYMQKVYLANYKKKYPRLKKGKDY